VARTPLARPTDAPPTAHRTAAEVAAHLAPEVAPDADQLLPDSDLPQHVAIIMDGNRRWARQHGVAELDGHAAGVEAIRTLLRHAVRRRVPVVNVYAFSS
jgi:undecaprenyl pyrophosphate synthase